MPGRGAPIAVLAAALALLAGACAGADDSNGVTPRNDQGAPANAIMRPDDSRVDRNDAAPEDTAGPELSGMTPYQRRAYDRGLGDCRAGRYDPDPYPEAYRIGCAAAQDRGGGEPPQG